LTGVQSGIVMQQEDLIHPPVWPDPSDLFLTTSLQSTYCCAVNVAPLSAVLMTAHTAVQ
jgi:hypothetical protein